MSKLWEYMFEGPGGLSLSGFGGAHARGIWDRQPMHRVATCRRHRLTSASLFREWRERGRVERVVNEGHNRPHC